MNRLVLTPNLTVEDVLSRWPQTAYVFFEYQTMCVGCTMAPFDTLAEVAANYGINLDNLLKALSRVLQTTETNQ